ncbi:MAG: ATP-binding protein [Verrucomicrobiales bacterium]|nr:ATP-binding protein [Verrucomicrobiales bacterium]
MMSAHALRPWTEFVKLHPDVEAGNLPEAVFAIDLGAIAERDPSVPVVNREPQAFFRATYLTSDLRKLLEEVLASLAGKPEYNRVLKLRTPFGGGKSHTLAALLHVARDRAALNVLPEAAGLPDPGKVDVAVFDGEKFDARDGKTLPDGRRIQTMWGWIAWQLGADKFKLVENHDKDRVSPGGDVIKQMLAGGPKLILLDEVLKYMERASALAVLDSTLQRQAKDFFQNLTVEVAGSKNAAMVYSLQWSARESLGNVALLQEIDKLASRVDQLREPVAGDEVLHVLHRRLLGGPPPAAAAQEVSESYSKVVTGMRQAHAETLSDRQHAEQEGLTMLNRMKAAYPFHPALIDVMRERWAAVDQFQRTRGALKFLSSCLHALKRDGGARALLGPAEIPLKNVEVRVKMLKELGVQNDYDAVIAADIEGPSARAKRIDERLARETPALANIKPATRLATAILVFSFGGLRRPGAGAEETLPSGVTETELLSSCVGPDLDSITANAVLAELRSTCLYLHFDGVRYCFKKDPNVTKLIEDAEQEVTREDTANPKVGPVRSGIKELLEKRLAGKQAIVWPETSGEIPNDEPRFLVAYLPLELAAETRAEQEKRGLTFLTQYGDKPRRYRNGIGLAIPEKKQVEALRRATRYLLAIDRVESQKAKHRLSKDQLDQLRERRRTEEAAAESAMRNLYTSIWLLRMESGAPALDKVEIGGRPLQATGVHERIMELLMNVGTPKVHATVTAAKAMQRVKLGETAVPGEPPRLLMKAGEMLNAFYEFLEPPRILSADVLKKAIVKGVTDSQFAWYSGPTLPLDSGNKIQASREKIVFGRAIAEDEVDFESGWLVIPAALPEATLIPTQPGQFQEQPGTAQPTSAAPNPQPGVSGQPSTAPDTQTTVSLRFTATRDQIYKAFPAIANLADKSDGGKIRVQIEGTKQTGFDPSWLTNAVEEPLDEANIENQK